MKALAHCTSISFALMLSACGLFPSAQERAEARTPDYKQGYSDGCAAANTTGVDPIKSPYRDKQLYQTSHAYRAGWSSGFSTCRNPSTGTTPESPLDNRLMNPSPGH